MHYCFENNHFSIKKVIYAGATVLSVLIIGILPFIHHIPALLSRLFPWNRGLTHSYWAPNLWSLYNFADCFLNFLINGKFKSQYTLGLVQISNHAVLPNIYPWMTLILIFIGISLLALRIRKFDSDMFIESLCLSGLIFFLFGWHVHEKAILMVTIPIM